MPMHRSLTEQEIETLRWLRGWKSTCNDTFAPLIFDRHRYMVLKGGGGSGKSVFAARYVMERATTEPGQRVLVTRKVERDIRESCFKLLTKTAQEFYADDIAFIPKGKTGPMYIRLTNGSEILCYGLDNEERLKSITDITMIWMEEASEFEQEDFAQLDIRLRTPFPWHLKMILSFNPISVNHWLKKRFFDYYDPEALVHESTYKDNRFLPESQIKVLENFRETNPYFYQVYCLGEWGVTGKTVFHADQLNDRLLQLKDVTPRQGFFTFTPIRNGTRLTDIRFMEDQGGPVKIYEEPKPGRPYVIGGDTAGDGSDLFAAQVLDNITGKQVAVLWHRYDEDEYARQVYCLGMYYNEALVGIETNFSTYPNKTLQNLGYHRLYVREIEDEFTGRMKMSFGFRTDRITRPVIIAGLVESMRDHASLLQDEQTIYEMLTFTRNQDMRPEAEPGAHDDLVMALAIAHYIRPRQSMTVQGGSEEKAGPRRKWTADMWQDYTGATPEMQAMMRRDWGDPE